MNRSVAVSAAVILTTAASVFAGYGSGSSGVSRPAPAPKPTPAPKPDNSAQIKQLNEAVVAYNKAQSDLAAVTTKLRTTFDTAPENAPVVAAFRADQAAYNARLAVVNEQLKSDPKYQKAVADRSGGQTKLATLRTTTPPPEAEIAETTKQLLASIAEVKRQEENAEGADPKLSPLRAALAASSDRVAALQKQFEASLPANTEWSAAKSAADSAKTHLDGLRKTK